MGMYDNIDYTMKCPICGHIVLGFQSKDKDCSMRLYEIWQVDNFYAICDNCESWIEFNLKEEVRKKFTINDYEMIFRKEENPRLSECPNCNEKVIPLFAEVCPNCNTNITKWIDEEGEECTKA